MTDLETNFQALKHSSGENQLVDEVTLAKFQRGNTRVGNGAPELAMKMDKGHAASLIGGLHVASSTITRMLDVALEDEPNGFDNEEKQ
ncbi:hypothetical protein [Hyphomicrobium facile]|uniref:hypothetical protein n=1 Tax=Hyphomicrobium facile TaxID=51670 RepID=UPI000B871702|nr:hypothetical protein [Hyphomicrobium facile]